MNTYIVSLSAPSHKRPDPYRPVPADAAPGQGREPLLLFALSIRCHNVPDAPCPVCDRPATYLPTEHYVFCRTCGWGKVLTSAQSHDLLWALLDLNDLRAGLLLRALVNSAPEPPPPYPDTLPVLRRLTAVDARYGLEGAA